MCAPYGELQFVYRSGCFVITEMVPANSTISRQAAFDPNYTSPKAINHKVVLEKDSIMSIFLFFI